MNKHLLRRRIKRPKYRDFEIFFQAKKAEPTSAFLSFCYFLEGFIFLIIIPAPFFERENAGKSYEVNDKNRRNHFPIEVISVH